MALVSSKDFLEIQGIIECRFTLKRVREMIITHSHPKVKDRRVTVFVGRRKVIRFKIC